MTLILFYVGANEYFFIPLKLAEEAAQMKDVVTNTSEPCFTLRVPKLAGTWADPGLLGSVIPGSAMGKVVYNDLTNSGDLPV